MSKLITKVSTLSTFRGNKASKNNANNSQHASLSNLTRYNEADESILRHHDENIMSANDTVSDLDTTVRMLANGTLRASNFPINNMFDQMTPEQLDEEFERTLLSSLNIKSLDVLASMRNYSPEKKKTLLQNHYKNNGYSEKPLNMANELKDIARSTKNLKENLKPLGKILKRIMVCISTKPLTWLEEFHQANGFQAIDEIIIDYKTKYSSLYNNSSGSQYFNASSMGRNSTMSGMSMSSFNEPIPSLSSSHTFLGHEFKDKDKDTIKEIRLDCMKILKSFVNTSYGIRVIMESKKSLMAIATGIDCYDPSTMNIACQLLAVLAVIDHEKVLAAISECAKLTGYPRFYFIVKGLTLDDKALQISAMTLINALISSAETLDFKIHLRSDFSRCGLIQAIEEIKNKYGSDIQDESDRLMTQILVFERKAQESFEEMDIQMENIVGAWDDIKSCFEYLHNTIKDTPCESFLLSIFQHLLLIRDDSHVRFAYYRVIEECVAKLVLNKDGRDPDFDSEKPTFNFEIDSFIKSIAEAAQSADLGGKGKLSSTDAKKLEKAIAERQELEARVQNLTTKLKCTDEALNELKQKVPNQVASEIEAMLLKRLNSESNSEITTSSSVPGPPPAPPMPPGLGFGSIPPPPPPPPPMPDFGGPPVPARPFSLPSNGPPIPPPPPPMPGFGGPPPPPPLPFSNGLSSGPPPPPPPFLAPMPIVDQLPFGLKEKPKYTVNQPMKRVNWNKVPTQKLSENCFWVKAKEDKFASSDLFDILQENFSTKPAKIKMTDTKNVDDSKKKANAKELKYIDDKQAQNIAIFLKSVKSDPKEICQWLIESRLDMLTPMMIEQIEKFLPEDRILKKYEELKENIDKLDNSEQFLVMISEIKGLRKRLGNFKFKFQFPELQEEIKVDLVAGTQACIDVKSSTKFQQLLEILLLAGNFLNSGSPKLEGSFGFDIRFLPNFYNTKANDHMRTLLHVLVQRIEEKHPLILNFAEDFDAFLCQATKIDPNVIQKSLTEMKTSISNLEVDLKVQRVRDKYVEVMETFLAEAKSRYETLERMFTQMNDAFKELVEFYAIDQTGSNKYTLGEFFTDLKTFCDQFHLCAVENQKRREAEEKAKRAEEDRLQREKEKQARKTQKEKIMRKTSCDESGENGVMDNLLEALQSGKLFGAGGSGGPGSNGPPMRPRRQNNRRENELRRTIVHRPSPTQLMHQTRSPAATYNVEIQ